MTLRLSKPNTRTFLSYVRGDAPVFAKDPAQFLSFTAVNTPSVSGRRPQTVLEVAAVGAEPFVGNLYLGLDADGRLALVDEPFGFPELKLGTSGSFQLGNETVIAIDKTEWMKAHGSSIWPTIIFLIILLIVAAALTYAGRNSPRDASYIFYRS